MKNRIKPYQVALISALSLPNSAQAGNDDLVRGIFGIIGGVMQQELQNQRPRGYPQGGYRVGQDEEAERIAARAEIQRRLNLLGFDAGVPDGVFGSRTRQAIAQFQRSIGAVPDGKISRGQIATLYQQTDVNSGSVQGQSSASNMLPAQAVVPGLTNAGPQNTNSPSAPLNAAPLPAITLPGTVSTAGQGTTGQGTTAVPFTNSAPVAQNTQPQAWQEPTSTVNTVATQSQTQATPAPNEAVYKTIREAVCKQNDSLYGSVRSFMAAGVVTKEQVTAEVLQSINLCMTSGRPARNFLVELAGKDIEIPLWYKSNGYIHGDQSNRYFDQVFLTYKGWNNVLITGNYVQVSLLAGEYPGGIDFRSNSDATRMILKNPNARDCFGFPPLYHAAKRNDFAFSKWIIENGGNPNQIVPYISDEAGVIDEAVDGSVVVSKGSYDSVGRKLKANYGCVDGGPSAALMNSYQAANELVPVWTFLLKNIDQSTSKPDDERARHFVDTIIPMIPSVPRSTIADWIDSQGRDININNPLLRDLVKQLVSKGADINAPTRKRGSPLKIWVANKISPEALQDMLAIGAQM